ncbi:MAG: hypothetical protein WCT52_04825 [Candidatus Micrarchaeia archaeon]
MALDDILISTGVDQLIKLVKEAGKVEIGVAAKELHQPIRTIEDWSHVLEDEGLVRVEYKLTKIYLVWQAPTKEYVAAKSEKIEKKAMQADGEIEQLMSKVEKGGEELAEMQDELARIQSAPPLSAQEAEKLKAELSSLEERYSASFETAMAKMAALEKKLAAVKPKIQGDRAKGEPDFSRDIASLSKFESTLQAQLDETDSFFESFQARLEEFKKHMESGKTDEKIDALKDELGAVRTLKDEILGAVEAIVDEQKAVDEKLRSAEKKLADLEGREDSVTTAKKKLAEIRRLSEDAKKQKKNVTGQLSDTLSLVRAQMSKIKEIGARQEEQKRVVDELKDEYVDISEEISRANEELAARQKEISARIALQVKTIDSGGRGGLTKEEVLKVSSLIRELKAEQARMEQNLRSLSKQTEVLKMEAEGAKAAGQARVMMNLPQGGSQEEPAARGAPSAGGQGMPSGADSGDVSIEFVEKVKLSQEEENDFERKRDELRSLIRKMWEESKGGS